MHRIFTRSIINPDNYLLFAQTNKRPDPLKVRDKNFKLNMIIISLKTFKLEVMILYCSD